MFDRDTFFDMVRKAPFPGRLNQGQVDGMEAILQTWESFYPEADLRHLGYPLSTSFHETGQTMLPIEEWGKGEGQPYGVEDPETNQTYFGRGLVQLTWRENYARADKELDLTAERSCEWFADNALVHDVACRVMFRGMMEGWFRSSDGKPETLERYFNASTDDAYHAREIINGDTSKNGKLCEGYHNDFMAALLAAVEAYVPEEEDLTVYDIYEIRVPFGTPFQIVKKLSPTATFPVIPETATAPGADVVYKGRRKRFKKQYHDVGR